MNRGQRLRIIWASIHKALRRRGWRATAEMILVALADERADRRRGLIADTFYDPSGLPVKSGPFANFYQPVRSGPLRRLFAELKPDVSQGFVDIGAGTGKAMILAAEWGFREVRGVEIAPALCELAAENFRRFAAATPAARFELVCGDALEFELRDDDGFLFLNDPFSEEVFALFVARVLALRARRARPLWLVYKNNNLRVMPSLERLKARAEYRELDVRGNRFQIFRF